MNPLNWLNSTWKQTLLLAGVVGALLLLVAVFTMSVSPTDKHRPDVLTTVFHDVDTRELTLGTLNKRLGDIESFEREWRSDRDDLRKGFANVEQIVSEMRQQVRSVKDGIDVLAKEESDTRDRVGLHGHSIEDLTKAVQTGHLPEDMGGGEAATTHAAAVKPAAAASPPADGKIPRDPRKLFEDQARETGGGAANGQVKPQGTAPTVTGIRRISDTREPTQIASTAPAEDDALYLAMGSIITGELINGVDAPTGEQSRKDPMPVLIRVSSEAILPNRFRQNIRDCFIIASGYGDLASERAYLRGEGVSCIREDGSAIDADLHSYMVGEDGKVGIRGRLVQKEGQFIARALMVGVMQGVAQGLNQNEIGSIGFNSSTGQLGVTQPQQNGFEGAALTGTGKALDRVAQYYLKMAEQIFPVIEIDAGRKIDLVVETGTKLSFKGNSNGHS